MTQESWRKSGTESVSELAKYFKGDKEKNSIFTPWAAANIHFTQAGNTFSEVADVSFINKWDEIIES